MFKGWIPPALHRIRRRFRQWRNLRRTVVRLEQRIDELEERLDGLERHARAEVIRNANGRRLLVS